MIGDQKLSATTWPLRMAGASPPPCARADAAGARTRAAAHSVRSAGNGMRGMFGLTVSSARRNVGRDGGARQWEPLREVACALPCHAGLSVRHPKEGTVRRGGSFIAAIIMAIIGAVTYFSSRSTNEVTGEVQHISIEPDQEVALGLQAFPEMAAQFGGEIDHPTISEYVEAVGQRVVQQSDARRGPYQYDFHVLNDAQTINAFALPGGQVSITLGLLRRLKDEAELAAVLGHEIGHVVGRHGAEQLSKQQFAQTLVGAATIA